MKEGAETLRGTIRLGDISIANMPCPVNTAVQLAFASRLSLFYAASGWPMELMEAVGTAMLSEP